MDPRGPPIQAPRPLGIQPGVRVLPEAAAPAVPAVVVGRKRPRNNNEPVPLAVGVQQPQQQQIGLSLAEKPALVPTLAQMAKTDAWHDFHPKRFSSSISTALTSGLPVGTPLGINETSEYGIFNEIMGTEFIWPLEETPESRIPGAAGRKTSHSYTLQVVKLRERTDRTDGPVKLTAAAKRERYPRMGAELATYAGLVNANLIVDFDGAALMTILKLGPASPGTLINYLIVPENINDAATKPSMKQAGNGVAIRTLIQDSTTATVYEPYSTTESSYLNDFFSRYTFEVGPIKHNNNNLATYLKITYNQGDKTYTDLLSDPKIENSITGVKKATKGLLSRSSTRARAADKSPYMSAPQTTITQGSLNNFKFNSRYQGKRSGDWLQVLACLDAPNRTFRDLAGNQTRIDGPVYLVTHDVIALSYALLMGVSVIFTNNNANGSFIYIFRTGVRPGRPLARRLAVAGLDFDGYNRTRETHLAKYSDTALGALAIKDEQKLLITLLQLAFYNTTYPELNSKSGVKMLPKIEKAKTEAMLRKRQHYINITTPGSETVNRTLKFILNHINDKTIIQRVVETIAPLARSPLMELTYNIFRGVASPGPVAPLLEHSYRMHGGPVPQALFELDEVGLTKIEIDDTDREAAQALLALGQPLVKRARYEGGAIPEGAVEAFISFEYDDDYELQLQVQEMEDNIQTAIPSLPRRSSSFSGGGTNYKALILPTYLLIKLAGQMAEVIKFNKKGWAIDYELYICLARFYILIIKELHAVAHDPARVAELHRVIVHLGVSPKAIAPGRSTDAIQLGGFERYNELTCISSLIVSDAIDTDRVPLPSLQEGALLQRIAKKVFVIPGYNKDAYNKFMILVHKRIQTTLKFIKQAENAAAPVAPAAPAPVSIMSNGLPLSILNRRAYSPRTLKLIRKQLDRQKAHRAQKHATRRRMRDKKKTLSQKPLYRPITGLARTATDSTAAESNLQRVFGGKASKYRRRFTRRR